MLFLLCICCA